MSIASEISRLQNAKSSIKTAIENKGVTVGSSLKLDDYDDCINAIQNGGGGPTSGMKIDFLMVAGGGSGGRGSMCGYGGGGGAGELLYCEGKYLKKSSYCIEIGAGGAKNDNGTNNGCNTCGLGYILIGGGGGGTMNSSGGTDGCPGGNGGGAGGTCAACKCTCSGLAIGPWTGNNGYGNGTTINSSKSGWGGGGAGGAGNGKSGGAGFTSSISGTSATYACGGSSCYNAVAASGYGSGGNGRYGGWNCACGGSAGCAGVAIISFTPQSGYTVTGGNSCLYCGGKCIRIFTSNGTLTIS